MDLRALALDVLLLGCMAVCAVLLYMVANIVMFHVCCGVAFLAAAAFALAQAQQAKRRLAKLGWFLALPSGPKQL